MDRVSVHVARKNSAKITYEEARRRPRQLSTQIALVDTGTMVIEWQFAQDKSILAILAILAKYQVRFSCCFSLRVG